MFALNVCLVKTQLMPQPSIVHWQCMCVGGYFAIVSVISVATPR